jgi:hypothetical protein
MSMTDTLTVELDMDVADQVVVSWLKENMRLIANIRGPEALDDEDYKAMQLILQYMMGPGYD